MDLNVNEWEDEKKIEEVKSKQTIVRKLSKQDEEIKEE